MLSPGMIPSSAFSFDVAASADWVGARDCVGTNEEGAGDCEGGREALAYGRVGQADLVLDFDAEIEFVAETDLEAETLIDGEAVLVGFGVSVWKLMSQLSLGVGESDGDCVGETETEFVGNGVYAGVSVTDGVAQAGSVSILVRSNVMAGRFLKDRVVANG